MFNCPQLKASGRNTCCLVCLFTKSFKMLPVDLNSACSNSCFGGKILSLWILDLEQCVCIFSLHFFISEWQIETVRVIGSCNHSGNGILHGTLVRWYIGSILNAPRDNQFSLELSLMPWMPLELLRFHISRHLVIRRRSSPLVGRGLPLLVLLVTSEKPSWYVHSPDVCIDTWLHR